MALKHSTAKTDIILQIMERLIAVILTTALLVTLNLVSAQPLLEVLAVNLSSYDAAEIKKEILEWGEARSKLPVMALPGEPQDLSRRIRARAETAIPFLISELKQYRNPTDQTRVVLPRSCILWVLSQTMPAKSIGAIGADTIEEEALWVTFWEKNYMRFMIDGKALTPDWNADSP